jgi:hypothetical protein
VVAEIFPGSFGSSDVLNGGFSIGDVSTRREEGIDVGSSLLDVAFDIHGESRSFGKSETEVKGDGSGNSTETDEETPSEVKVAELEERESDPEARKKTGEKEKSSSLSVVDGIVENLLLEGGEDGDRDDSSSELTPTLRPEGGNHHTTTDASSGEFGSDTGRERVVSSDSDTHDESPHDEDTDDRDGGTVTGDSLTESCDDDWKKRKKLELGRILVVAARQVGDDLLIISSIPYMRLRPTRSANQPNKS